MLLFAFALLNPPAMQIPEPAPQTLEALENQMLEAFDFGFEARLPSLPPDRNLDTAKLTWLHGAAYLSMPVSVFPNGSLEHGEAVRIIDFLKAKVPPTVASLNSLNMRLTGSHLALWRYGQAAIRDGTWNQNIRIHWENILMDKSVHPLIRGLALRHALCWALAEKDDVRLANLKNSSVGAEMPSLFPLFQKAFASLGGSLSPLRLWTSSFNPVENYEAHAHRIWLCPDPDFSPPEKTMDWIVPLLEGSLVGSRENPLWRPGAERLLKEDGFGDYNVMVAPFKKDLELLGIALFPALVELDSGGKITGIKMGDACPRQ